MKKILNPKLILLILFGFIALNGCAATNGNENGINFILYVSNQNLDVNPVDIMVYIDDELVIDKEFDATGERTPQHNWQKFEFNLTEGQHRLIVESIKGSAKLEKEFMLKGKQWAVIDYWYQKFSFDIQNKPILFE
jgi:hypothetical protein